MRLLLVEDEEKTSSYVSLALSESGFTVDIAGDGIDGLHLAVQQEYDAVILDVMLPGKDGYPVLEGLRAIKQTPVLMLSARGSVDERVRGLRHGADDYLPKPFSLIELVARIQALLRPHPGLKKAWSDQIPVVSGHCQQFCTPASALITKVAGRMLYSFTK